MTYKLAIIPGGAVVSCSGSAKVTLGVQQHLLVAGHGALNDCKFLCFGRRGNAHARRVGAPLPKPLVLLLVCLVILISIVAKGTQEGI